MSLQRINAVTKILNGIELDRDTDIDYLYSRKRTRAFKDIVKFRSCKTSKEVELYLRELDKFPKQASFEKYKIIYGEELALLKMKEFGEVRKNTQETFIKRHGETEGISKWAAYCNKHSFKNTFEGKTKKYGWSEEEFKEYNRSRSVTIENMIAKYGEKIGTEKYNSYCKKQAYTNTEEYLGTERYLKVNKQKSHSLSSYIEKYGEKEGRRKFEAFISKAKPPYSKVSQKLFDRLVNTPEFKNNRCYYATLNNEFIIYDKENKKVIFCDFVDYDRKLCVEFDGDHYHGNPLYYGPDDILKGKGQREPAKAVWARDSFRISRIEKIFGFKVIRIWESDWHKDPDAVIERIIEYAKSIV